MRGLSAKLLLSTILTCGSVGPAFAQITTDGTTPTTCNGGGCISSTGAVSIAGGVIAGSNQFHSFTDFNIAAGDSATFNGPAGLSNVISRVTGGIPTNIFGSLVSNVDGADFYFLNPNGIMVGDSASIDVPGGFHVAALEELGAVSGETFGTGASSSFFASSPASFGFSGQSADLQFHTDILAFGGAVTLAGNGVQVGDNTEPEVVLYTPLDLNVVSGSDGQFSMNTRLVSEDFVRADLTLENVMIDTFQVLSFDKAGSISIFGADVNLDTARFDLSATGNNFDFGPAGDFLLVSDALIATDVLINSSAFNGTVSGLIGIGADGDAVFTDFDIISAVEGGSVGQGIAIGVGGRLELLGASEILSVSANQAGQNDLSAGPIVVFADSLLLAEQSTIQTSSLSGGSDASPIIIQVTNDIELAAGPDNFGSGPEFFAINVPTPTIFSTTRSAANGGNIVISAASMNNNGGNINSSSFGDGGNPGSISLNIENDLTIQYDGALEGVASGLGVQQLGQSSDGSDSFIIINAGSFLLSGFATVTTAVASNGNGAGIKITVEENTTVSNDASISARSAIQGNPALPINQINDGFSTGSITIETGSLIVDDGVISTTTNSPHDSGLVDITVRDSFLLDGGEISSASGDSSNTVVAVATENLGDAGDLRFTIGGLTTLSGGEISSSTLIDGRAGTISLETNGLVLSGASEIASSTSGSGNAGSIDITASMSTISGDETSTISTSTSSAGDAGSISIDAETILAGFDVRSASEGSGSAGNIQIASNVFELQNGNEVSTTGGSDTGQSEISVTANDSLVLRGEVTTTTTSALDAGDISIVAGTALFEGPSVSTNTIGRGDAGDVIINVDSLLVRGTLDEFNELVGENVSSRSQVFGADMAAGNAGDVIIMSVGDVILENGAQIQSESDSPFEDGGFAGDVSVTVTDGRLILRENAEIGSTGFEVPGGNISISVSDLISLADESSIEIGALTSGGDLTINLGSEGVLVLSGNSFINTDAGRAFSEEFGGIIDDESGAGGAISIGPIESGKPILIVLLDSLITARGDNPLARLDIDSGAFLLQDNRSQITIDGTITTPDAQAGGDTEQLDEGFENADQVLASQCAAQKGGAASTLASMPNMGLAVDSKLKPSPFGGVIFYDNDGSRVETASNHNWKIDGECL